MGVTNVFRKVFSCVWHMLYGSSYVTAQSSIKLDVENSPEGKTWGTSIDEQVV